MNPLACVLFLALGVAEPNDPIPDLLRQLDDKSHDARRQAVAKLTAMGADQKDVIAKLATLLKKADRDPTGKSRGTPLDPNLPLQIRWKVESLQGDLRWEVLLALGKIALKNDDAVSPLIDAVEDPDLADGTFLILRALGPKAAKAAPALCKLMQSHERRLKPFLSEQHMLIEAVAALGEAAIPQLILGLESPKKVVRYHSAVALGRMGSIAEKPLLKALESPIARVREVAVQGLVYMPGKSPAPGQGLERALVGGREPGQCLWRHFLLGSRLAEGAQG
jgi:HEAT repeat protein